MKPWFKSSLLTLPMFCLFQLSSAQGLPVRWANFYPPDWEANNFTAEGIIEITNGGLVVVGTRRMEKSFSDSHKDLQARVYLSIGGLEDPNGIAAPEIYQSIHFITHKQ